MLFRSRITKTIETTLAKIGRSMKKCEMRMARLLRLGLRTGLRQRLLLRSHRLARAHTRHMIEFCSVDKRLLPTGYIPLADFELTKEATRQAIKAGARALMIPSRCPDGHSPSHIGLDPLWAMAQEAGLPIVLHEIGRAHV